MPGPSNRKKPRKSSGSKPKKRASLPPAPPVDKEPPKPATSVAGPSTGNDGRGSDAFFDATNTYHNSGRGPECTPPTAHAKPLPQPPSPFDSYAYPAAPTYTIEHLPEEPFEPLPPLHDPGNGARVRDVAAFLSSRFSFAERPASPGDEEDPLPAEFAREEVREMLKEVLPEECALILWYNKSRRSSRICPSCHRLYKLGDILPELYPSASSNIMREPKAERRLRTEQEMSGLCSPLCFVLASHHQPARRDSDAIRGSWGRMAEDMDDEAWLALGGDSPSYPELECENDALGDQSELAKALGLLVRMTRLHDLGLGQMFFPDVDVDSEAMPAGMS